MIETINTLGCVGGGQLGRMTTIAAKQLGFEVAVLDPADHCPAAQVGAIQIQAPLDDRAAIHRLAGMSDVLTWEIEHIPAEVLAALMRFGVDVQPNPDTLAIIQDKLQQHQFLSRHGIPVAPFSSFEDAAALGGDRFVVKSRMGGFDGRGNLVVANLDDLAIAEKFQDKPVYVERRLTLQQELAVIAVRNRAGNIVTYPVAETVHENDICHTVMSPAQIDPAIRADATDVAHETLKRLGGAGVFAIELFVDGDDRVMVNEIAPRPHNSGHHTLNSCYDSQFDQHARVVMGLPFGSTKQHAPVAVMVNILGREKPFTREGMIAAMKLGAKVHLYGKSSRVARKLGHFTVLGERADETMQRANRAHDLFWANAA